MQIVLLARQQLGIVVRKHVWIRREEGLIVSWATQDQNPIETSWNLQLVSIGFNWFQLVSIGFNRNTNFSVETNCLTGKCLDWLSIPVQTNWRGQLVPVGRQFPVTQLVPVGRQFQVVQLVPVRRKFLVAQLVPVGRQFPVAQLILVISSYPTGSS